jgi:iron complex transport system permease protein
MLGLSAFAFASAVLAVSVGTSSVGLFDAARALVGASTDPTAAAIVSLRVSRVALAALVGASLGCAGVALQALLRNPLADPYILGVSGGGALAAALFLTFGAAGFSAVGVAVTNAGLSGLAVAAFAGSLAASAVVLFAGRKKGHILPGTLLLVGVMVNALSGAAVLALTYLSDVAESHSIVVWLMGNLGTLSLSRAALAAAAVAALILVALLWRLGGRLNLLSLGDEPAATLGVDVPRTRLAAFALSALATGLSVALAGPIGFVGLIVPHITRYLVGSDHRFLFPAAAVFGAAFLILADAAARTALVIASSLSPGSASQGGELPVGVLTAVFGAPVFIWILRSRRGRYFE